jgi:EAL domain-containing protein (putative c-di-GMP-specific phosphodiesterase class I)
MCNVLLIDDDPNVLRAFRRVLADAGHEVTVATDGGAGSAVLANRRFDAVVTDLRMNGVNGADVLRRARQVDPDVPVVVMTGTPSTGSAAEAVGLGAYRYLVKPVDPGLLCRTIDLAARTCVDARWRRRVLELAAESAPTDRGDALDRALSTLWLATQPIVDVPERRVVAWEALLRTNEPTLRGPHDLLAAAASHGRLRELSRTIRRRAADIARTLPEGARLYVNAHPDDLADDALYAATEPLSAVGSRVVLEITERASLHLVTDLPARIARLRGLGFGIAIDDLGAGYSGLMAMTQLKPDVVKLDMSLVRGIDRSPIQQAVVRSLANLCRDLGVEVVAEGVETADERDAVEHAGIARMQGFLFARPAEGLPQPTL